MKFIEGLRESLSHLTPEGRYQQSQQNFLEALQRRLSNFEDSFAASENLYHFDTITKNSEYFRNVIAYIPDISTNSHQLLRSPKQGLVVTFSEQFCDTKYRYNHRSSEYNVYIGVKDGQMVIVDIGYQFHHGPGVNHYCKFEEPNSVFHLPIPIAHLHAASVLDTITTHLNQPPK